uniref:E3 ubiquitin-protein ligase CBL n=1 Tax=Nothobranchius furzeri TaxID=105023 RepID=A0A8C6KMC1_NOTFU
SGGKKRFVDGKILDACLKRASKSPKLSSQFPTREDLRLQEKASKRLQKLKELCTNARLGLKNSPPYLPELVRETATLLSQVWEPYKGLGPSAGLLPRGDEAKYLRVHIKNLLDKTDRAVLLFKDGKERMFDETSSHRRNLTKLSLLFSHMLWELKAMFPGGYFQGDTFKVAKPEADQFWRKSFDNMYVDHVCHVQGFEGMESMALKSTIDLTCNDHISVFEFDTFIRLFQVSLEDVLERYMAFLTYDQVVARLEHCLHKPGR